MPYNKRVHRLQNSLASLGCAALLIENPIDLYYLTGIELSTGKLLLSHSHAVLVVDQRYAELCRRQSSLPIWNAETYPLDICFASSEFSSVETLGFDSATTSYKNYVLLKNLGEKRALQIIPIDSPTQNLRAIKDKHELKLLADAANLGSLGFDYVVSLLKEGITEIEVANELEIFWKKKGSKGLAFDPIIAFGANSAMPHYHAGEARLKKGDIVLIDIGVNLKHYHSDMTRTVFFGEPNEKLIDIHAIVLEAQKAALSLCKPGTTLGELDKAARGFITSKGFGPQFSHSLGHGIGLEIHEFPAVKNLPPYDSVKLAPGMVITIEPGIYVSELGGVRIEDSIVITELEYNNLTQRSPNFLIIES